MNKQALAFLSMFTLVLMLSIYYVSLEDDPLTSVIAPPTTIDSAVSALKTKVLNTKNEIILTLKEVIASKTSTQEDKNQALKEVDQIENSKSQEKQIEQLLKDKGYTSVIEIENDVVKIHLFETEKGSEKAMEILSLIHPKLIENQTMELVFS